MNNEVREKRRKYQRDLYADRKKWGLCPRCGGKRDVEHRLRCSKCMKYEAGIQAARYDRESATNARRERKQRNRDAGLCACGKPPSPGYTTCIQCRMRSRKHAKEHYRRKYVYSKEGTEESE